MNGAHCSKPIELAIHSENCRSGRRKLLPVLVEFVDEPIDDGNSYRFEVCRTLRKLADRIILCGIL